MTLEKFIKERDQTMEGKMSVIFIPSCEYKQNRKRPTIALWKTSPKQLMLLILIYL